MSQAFRKLPPSASAKPETFTVSIPKSTLEEFHSLLEMSKIGPATFENSQVDGKYGITREWLKNAKEQWLKFDWRKTEEDINTFPNYKLSVDDSGSIFDIHFVAIFSERNNATPVLMLHGWPGSFLEFLPIMQILMTKYTPSTLPYHIIVPSLPGYAFSSPPPRDRDFQIQDVARILNNLMIQLGFGTGYVVQDGDIGSKVARVLGGVHDEAKAIHLNFSIMPDPGNISSSEYSEAERVGLLRAEEFSRIGSAYALEHATKPSTIGLVLSSSPLALLAWIGEKFLAWTDEDPPLSTILESVTLYWLTDCFATSIYPYRQLFTPGNIGAHENPIWHINKPLGFSWFPKELAPVPKAWTATTGDLVYFRPHEKGGHFAAIEQPAVLLNDLSDFIAQVWPTV